jgi:hypothetical protein
MQSAKTAAQSWDGELLGKVFQLCYRLQPFFDSGEIGSVFPMGLGGKVDSVPSFALRKDCHNDIPCGYKMLISTYHLIVTFPQRIFLCYLLG